MMDALHGKNYKDMAEELQSGVALEAVSMYVWRRVELVNGKI